MRQLFCRDLRPGDVLLRLPTRFSEIEGDKVLRKAGEAVLHRFIGLGQLPGHLIGNHPTWFAHAAIALDTQFVIEARRGGITANHMAMATRADKTLGNESWGAYVYHCKDSALAQGAATCAKMFFDIAQTHGNMKYSAKGALGSAVRPVFRSEKPAKSAEEMDGMIQRLLEGLGHPFFCSQFVVYVYQFAAYQSEIPAKAVFDMSDAKVPPWVLASLMDRNSVYFRFGGCILPGERSVPISIG